LGLNLSSARICVILDKSLNLPEFARQ
jgi:hypothetical protein